MAATDYLIDQAFVAGVPQTFKETMPRGHTVMVQCDANLTVQFWNGAAYQATGEVIAAPGGTLRCPNKAVKLTADANTQVRVLHAKD